MSYFQGEIFHPYSMSPNVELLITMENAQRFILITSIGEIFRAITVLLKRTEHLVLATCLKKMFSLGNFGTNMQYIFLVILAFISTVKCQKKSQPS